MQEHDETAQRRAEEDGGAGRSPIPRRADGDSAAAGGAAVADAARAGGRADVSLGAPASPGAVGLSPLGRGLGSREAWLLAVCCVAQFMVILDLSIVNVALPSIQSSLGFSAPELQWSGDA